MKAAVVTAVYGGYDTVKPPLAQSLADVDWVCVTDEPDAVPDGWRAVHAPRPDTTSMRAAKAAKFEPWRFTDAPASVWIDASYRVTSPDFVNEVLGYATVGQGIAQFVHPWRDCLFAEAAFSATLPKYAGEPLAEQAAAYRKRGMPEHWGLWAAGVIARLHSTAVRAFGALWAVQGALWSFQDQVSEPYALRARGLRPMALPGDHLTNRWLSYEGSEKHG